jgi:hypothetical protein
MFPLSAVKCVVKQEVENEKLETHDHQYEFQKALNELEN